MFKSLLYILLAIFILLFMVLIHEFGHYVVGKALKFKINEFSIGFGKALFSHTNKRGEKISLRIFPLGGYCAFAGEDGTDENGKPIADKDAFSNQKPWKRILVFLAGATFNFLTAIIFSFILLVSFGADIYKFEKMEPFDEQIISYEVAQEYQDNKQLHTLQKGDVVFYVDDTKVDLAYSMSFSDLLNREHNELLAWIDAETKKQTEAGIKNPVIDITEYPAVKFSVRRDGKMEDVELYYTKITYHVYVRDLNGEVVYKDDKPLVVYETDKEGNTVVDEDGSPKPKVYVSYTLGTEIEGTDAQNVKIGTGLYTLYRHSFVEALARCVPFAFGLAWLVLKALWALITSFTAHISQIGGPITTITTIASGTSQNLVNILPMIASISANLAVFNLLPIPALDGAHVVFTLIEWVRKKPIKREVENMIHSIGLMILFGFVILVDILHLIL